MQKKKAASRKKPQVDPIKVSAEKIAKKHGCDVIFFNAGTLRASADKVLDMVAARRARREKVLLVLVTPGGVAESAYRIARCLQGSYKHYSVLVPGWCKSAGTLCVLGANELVMSDCAELGPLDVQLQKKDELWESNSGLVLMEALRTLRDQAFSMYEEYMLHIKENGEGAISFKMATQIATRMATSLYEPLFKQIDPIQVGDTARAMAIARAYGERLQIRAQNLRKDALETLISSYPEHGFVIDRREAREIFNRVREPNNEERALISALGDAARYPATKQPQIPRYLTDEPSGRPHAQQQDASKGPKSRATPSDSAARKRRNAGNIGSPAPDPRAAPVTPEKRISLVPKKNSG